MVALLSISSNTNNNNMGIELSSQNLNHVTEVQVSEPKANGKTCHQCRQKTVKLAASCKNLKAGKPCVNRYCHKCLLNRYGEKAAEVELLSKWCCPKCRGECNCSCCRKRQGLVPTGQLAHTAKASGFKSVADMLQNVNNVADPPMVEATLERELVVILPGESGKENSLDGNSGFKLDSLKDQKKSPEKSKKTKRGGLKEISNGSSVDDACENRSQKRSKICNEVPEEESKRNANDGIKLLHEVSEKEMKVARNHDIVYGEMDGPEKWGANDFLCNLYDVKEDMCVKNWIGNGVSDDDDNNAGIKSQMGIAQAPEFRICTVNSEIKKIEEVPLPPGTMLTEISGIEFSPEDVGNALQFLEFCRVFGKALEVKKGEAEAILREMVRKQSLRRGENMLAVNFQIKLLTVILINSGIKSPSLTTTDGNNSWLKALEDVISGSIVLKEFPLDGYYNLDLSKKFSLLNFLCDEALGTEQLRSYIDDQKLIFAEEMKAAKCKVAAAKEKEKCLKQKLQDEVFKAIASNGSISEHDDLVSKIKSETAEAHAELLEAKEAIPKRKQGSDATRIDPVFLDDNGHTFWQLKSYTAKDAVLLQDIKVHDVDGIADDEKWFVYDLEKKHEVEKYISSRAKRPKAQKVSYMLPNESGSAIV